MLLNWCEKALMNNPLRAACQRWFEARRLLAMGGGLTGGRALEVGCGQGVGTGIILDVFGAERVDAFDFDRHMVGRAQARLAGRREVVQLWQGDAAAIAAPDAAYDAVFDFGIIHHVPVWRDALKEAHRVLKPGGRFYVEEVLKRFVHNPVSLRLFDHPLEGRFDHDAFRRGLEDCGFRVLDSNHLWQLMGWFVAEK